MSTQNAKATRPDGVVVPEWTFADRLRKARQVAGMTQIEFASNLGDVTAGAYAQWEAGNTRPRDIVTVAKSIQLLTRVPATWLLGVDIAPVGPGGLEPPASSVKAGELVQGPWGRDERSEMGA